MISAAFIALCNLLRHFKRGKTELRQENQEWLDYRRRVDECIASGFKAWAHTPPPRDQLVECCGAWTGLNFEIIPRDMHPQTNVMHLYWRPARPMKTINAESPLYLH